MFYDLLFSLCDYRQCTFKVQSYWKSWETWSITLIFGGCKRGDMRWRRLLNVSQKNSHDPVKTELNWISGWQISWNSHFIHRFQFSRLVKIRTVLKLFRFVAGKVQIVVFSRYSYLKAFFEQKLHITLHVELKYPIRYQVWLPYYMDFMRGAFLFLL